MKYIKNILLIFLSFLFVNTSHSQNLGYPFIQNYNTEDYGGASQNWSFIQDDNGILLVGNGEGLLEYDGTNWRMIKIPNNSHVRSLSKNETGKIYIGGLNEIGYLEIDSAGKYEYISLVNKIPVKHRKFSYVWHNCEINGDFFFQTINKLYFLSKNSSDSFKIISTDKKYQASFVINNVLYVNEWEVGLKKYINDSLSLIYNGNEFSDKQIMGMIEEGNKQIIIVTRDKGLYKFKYGSNTKASSLELLKTEVSEILRKKNVYNVLKATNGKYYFSTLLGGILVTDKDFNTLYTINNEKGLINNQVLSLYEDSYNNIWAGTGNGISYINSSSPITKYEESSGIKGQVYSATIYREIMYVGCSDGVYYLQKGGRFRKIDILSDQTWFIKTINDTLFCGNRHGYLTILDTIPKIGDLKDNIWLAVNYPNSELQLVGTYSNGLVMMRKEGDVWVVNDYIRGYNESARFFDIDKDGYIWITTQSNGVSRLKLNAELDSVIENLVYDVNKGMPENGQNYVFKITDEKGNPEIIFATKKGIYKHDNINDSIVPYLLFNDLLGTNQIDLFVEDSRKNIWFQAEVDNRYFKGVLLMQKDGSYKLFDKFFYKFHKVYAEGISVFENNVFFSTAKGVYINQNFNPEKKVISYPIIIREISLTDSIIYYGNKYDSLEINNNFSYKNNALIFKFSAPFFEDSEETKYSWMLKGFDEKWSELSGKPEKEYTNLPEGDYVFKVKALNIYRQSSSIAEFSFTILPPWHRTTYAYIAYFILGTFFIWLIVKFNTRRLKKDKEKLEKIVKERTVEIYQQKEEIQTQADNLKETNTKLIESNEEINQQKEEIQAIADNLKEANSKISGFNKELKVANEEIKQKNKHITDSIQYAKRIQKAVLMKQEGINDYFPDNFILFKPKEIVSGDFHRFEKIEDYYLFAAVDCTGHGVPGAFMSMLAYAFLSEIITKKEITQTDEVLELLRKNIKKALHQDEGISKQKDGLDIALCALNSKTLELQYSGAHNSLYIIPDNNNFDKRKESIINNKRIHIHSFSSEYISENKVSTAKSLIEVKGDKMPVGFSMKEKKFSMQKIQLFKGDRIYLFSDGYIDQFGGDYNRKFLYYNFRDLLIEISDRPMKTQKKNLLETFYSWKGKNPQLDDILIMGMKI